MTFLFFFYFEGLPLRYILTFRSEVVIITTIYIIYSSSCLISVLISSSSSDTRSTVPWYEVSGIPVG